MELEEKIIEFTFGVSSTYDKAIINDFDIAKDMIPNASPKYETTITVPQPGTTYFLKYLVWLPTKFYYSEIIELTTDENQGEVECVDADGKSYKTVKIGEQWWMAENLAYDVGDGCWAYNNDESNVANYGRLYTWEAAKEACPPGWHLPTDDEWKQLEMAIGMSQNQADDAGWRGTNEGAKLKAANGWNNNGNGTDDFGLFALPGGYRYNNGNFSEIGDFGGWWSAIEKNDNYAWYRKLYFDKSNISRVTTNKEVGLSVRCVRD